MSYDDKISRATSLITDLNGKMTDSPIDVKKFISNLEKAGGVTEAMLQECTWEELQKCGLPSLVARRVAAIFREPTTKQDTDSEYIGEKKAAKMAPRYLIAAYNPDDKNSAVHKRLAELSNGKKFLVFKSDGSVNVDASEKLFNEIRTGYPERDSIEIDGRPVKVNAVGVDPLKKLVDENPLYPGRALRPDGTCDQMNRSWDGVATAVRQLLYLAVTKTGEVRVMNLDKAHEMLDLALAADAEKRIRSRYKKASILLDEAVATSTAPSLKITLNVDEKKNDPFTVGHRTF